MSGPLKFPQSTGLTQVRCRVLVSYTGHVWLLDQTCPINTIFVVAKSVAGLIRPGNHVPEALPNMVPIPDMSGPSALTQAKSLYRTCPVSWSGSKEVC
jgi:hypothetical protein